MSNEPNQTKSNPEPQRFRFWSFLKLAFLTFVFLSGFFLSELCPYHPITKFYRYLGSKTPIHTVTAATSPEKRFFFFRPEAAYRISDVVVPGRYTIVVLSAEWCAPCTVLRRELKQATELNSQIVVVDIDVSKAKSSSHFSLAPFGLSSVNVALPSVFVFDPYWSVINPGDKPSIPPPIQGYDAAHLKLAFLLAKDSRMDSVPSADHAINRLTAIERGSDHYALKAK